MLEPRGLAVLSLLQTMATKDGGDGTGDMQKGEDRHSASASRKKVFAYLAYLFHKRIIIHLHLGDEKKILDPTLNRKLIQLLHYADCIIVLSPQWKRWLLEVMPEVEPIVRILYNPCVTVNRATTIKKKKT